MTPHYNRLTETALTYVSIEKYKKLALIIPVIPSYLEFWPQLQYFRYVRQCPNYRLKRFLPPPPPPCEKRTRDRYFSWSALNPLICWGSIHQPQDQHIFILKFHFKSVHYIYLGAFQPTNMQKISYCYHILQWILVKTTLFVTKDLAVKSNLLL